MPLLSVVVCSVDAVGKALVASVRKDDDGGVGSAGASARAASRACREARRMSSRVQRSTRDRRIGSLADLIKSSTLRESESWTLVRTRLRTPQTRRSPRRLDFRTTMQRGTECAEQLHDLS